MTEKRFTETISTMTVTDNQTGREYKCEMGIDTDLLGLLNMLHEENQELKKEIENQQKLLQAFEKISEKYNIKLEDIPVTFEEYVALDNGEEL